MNIVETEIGRVVFTYSTATLYPNQVGLSDAEMLEALSEATGREWALEDDMTTEVSFTLIDD